MVSTPVIMTLCHLHSAVVGVPEFPELVHRARLRFVQGFDEFLLGPLAVPVNSGFFYSEGFEKLVFVGGHYVDQVSDCLNRMVLTA